MIYDSGGQAAWSVDDPDAFYRATQVLRQEELNVFLDPDGTAALAAAPTGEILRALKPKRTVGELRMRLEVKQRWHFKLWIGLGYLYVSAVAWLNGDADRAIDRAASLASHMGLKITIGHADNDP